MRVAEQSKASIRDYLICSTRHLPTGRLFNKTFAKWDVCSTGHLPNNQVFYLTTNDPLNTKLGQIRSGQVSNNYFDPINPRLGQVSKNFSKHPFPSWQMSCRTNVLVGKCLVKQKRQSRFILGILSIRCLKLSESNIKHLNGRVGCFIGSQFPVLQTNCKYFVVPLTPDL